jgi:hypothetical protein
MLMGDRFHGEGRIVSVGGGMSLNRWWMMDNNFGVGLN